MDLPLVPTLQFVPSYAPALARFCHFDMSVALRHLDFHKINDSTKCHLKCLLRDADTGPVFNIWVQICMGLDFSRT